MKGDEWRRRYSGFGKFNCEIQQSKLQRTVLWLRIQKFGSDIVNRNR